MLDAQWVGPPLNQGPKPAIFYFALSANDSLYLDPFNQPVVALQESDIRICSITLPGHDHLPKETAINSWQQQHLEIFVQKVCEYITDLMHKKVITKCAVMGLSRGGYIAAHVASRVPTIQTLLGFAPLTNLSSMPEWDLHYLNDQLYFKTIRCYIGNRDVRVGTEKTFLWLSGVTNTAFEKGIRTAPIELIITPSIGREGHGTAPEIFKAGSLWLASQVTNET